jgi:hypothetical protein
MTVPSSRYTSSVVKSEVIHRLCAANLNSPHEIAGCRTGKYDIFCQHLSFALNWRTCEVVDPVQSRLSFEALLKWLGTHHLAIRDLIWI